MVDADTIRNAVGILGNIISFGLFLSPLPTFITILKKKAVEQYSPIPYLATYINCLLWVLYGLPIVHPGGLLIITINGIGLVIEGAYILIFLIYSPRKLRLKVALILMGEFLFVGAVAAVVLLTAHTHEKRSFIVGVFCVVFGTGMYVAPLAVMKMVIQTKSVKYMPFMLSFVGFLNGLCWLTYALIKFDIFVTVPNGLGVLFGLAQLVLYACYYKSTPTEKEHATVELSQQSKV